jgi:hypothetical protein
VRADVLEPSLSAQIGLMRCSKTASSFEQAVHVDGLQPFAERDAMEMSDHSGLMPANWITFSHFSDSATT